MNSIRSYCSDSTNSPPRDEQFPQFSPWNPSTSPNVPRAISPYEMNLANRLHIICANSQKNPDG